MIRPPDTELDPGQLRQDLDATVERFRSSTLALTVWTLIVMVLELVFFPEIRWQSVGFASAMVAIVVPSQLLLRRGRFPGQMAEPIGVLILVLRTTHLGLAYYRTGSSLYPLLLMNAVLAGAGLSLTLRGLVAVVALGTMAWTAGLLRHATALVDLVGGFAALASTGLVSVVLYVARVRHGAKMERMRARDRRQREELATALAAAERELQDRKQAEEERERLRDQLSHAQKMEAVGTLAGGFAHDLNNMLGVVIGLSEIVRESTAGQVREDVDQILASCRRGSELTRNLLGFSRRGQYRVERIDMASVVREVSKLLSRTIPKSVTLDVELDAGAHVLGDSTQLGQVLLNLCLNSVDAMADGGQLMLRVVRVDLDEEHAARAGVRPGPHVALSVGDSGCGMSEETRQRMFEPFFTTRRERGGTGLGLAMVYGTTMKHNGGIEVESATGAGTRITVYLPYASRADAARLAAEAEGRPDAAEAVGVRAGRREPAPLISRHISIIGELPAIEDGARKSAPLAPAAGPATAVQAAPPAAAAPPGAPDTRGCILIVDDEPMVRAVVRRTLRRAGYHVLEATDGRDGVAVFERSRAEIGLVILDMAMPIMGGAACFTRLREIDPTALVILASGFAAEEEAQGCLRRGAICFLEKPYTSAALLAAIAGALEPGSPAARPRTGEVSLSRVAE